MAMIYDLLHRLGVIEKNILRQKFGPKRDENLEWRRLHNE